VIYTIRIFQAREKAILIIGTLYLRIASIQIKFGKLFKIFFYSTGLCIITRYIIHRAHRSHRLRTSVAYNNNILCINVTKTENKFKMYYNLYYSVNTFYLFTNTLIVNIIK